MSEAAEPFFIRQMSPKHWVVIERATRREKGRFESGPKSSAEPRAQAMANRLNAAAAAAIVDSANGAKQRQ